MDLRDTIGAKLDSLKPQFEAAMDDLVDDALRVIDRKVSEVSALIEQWRQK